MNIWFSLVRPQRLILPFIVMACISTGAPAQDVNLSDLSYADQVQKMYIAYYGRPGDPGGINFWVGRLDDSNGSLAAIIDSFGSSSEYNDRFGSLANATLVNNIYLQLFSRDADTGGLNFYTGRLDSGENSLASIALNIADGVQPGTDDAAIIINKLIVADAFTDAIESRGADYGAAQIDAAKGLLNGVSGSDTSLASGLANADSVVDNIVNSDGDATDQDAQFSGFNFPLSQGDFWEFAWDATQSSFSQGSGSSTSHADGVFRITLDAPHIIDGITAYTLQISGNSATTFADFTPRWNYLAIDGHRVLGSADGSSLQVIFDAIDGIWAGGGFFTTLPDNVLSTASNGLINNDYLNESAISAGRSANQDQCEIILDIRICGDDSFTSSEFEYYKSAVGPYGYRYYNAYSFCGGGFCSGGSDENNVGLVAASLRGDTVDYLLETEPNNSASDAMSLTLPAQVRGEVLNETEYGGSTAITKSESEPNNDFDTAQSTSFPDAISGSVSEDDTATTISIAEAGSAPAYDASFEDFYKLTLATSSRLYSRLSFPDAPGADLDFYLFVLEPGLAYVDRAISDNVLSANPSETIDVNLNAGTYYLALDAYATPAGPASYLLQIDDSSLFDTLEVVDWYRLTLTSAQRLRIDASGGVDVVLTTEDGTLLGSDRPASEDADTLILSDTLAADSYLIGIGASSGEYQLEVRVD